MPRATPGAPPPSSGPWRRTAWSGGARPAGTPPPTTTPRTPRSTSAALAAPRWCSWTPATVGMLRRVASAWLPAAVGPTPHAEVNIRGTGGAEVVIVVSSDGRMLGTIDAIRARSQVHPGALYLHQGESFVVDDLDLEDGL